MGVDGVNGLSRQNTYDDSDIDQMKGKEALSTNAAINRIGNHAGLGDTHTVRANDKTSGEIVAEHRAEVAKEWTPGAGELKQEAKTHVAIAVAEHGLKHVGLHFAARALGGAALPAALVQFAFKMTKSVAADSKVGHEVAEAKVKSAMHTVVLGSLNGLPQAFVNAQRGRYAADAPDGLVERMSRAMGRGDNDLMGVIQLHCDQGIAAARAMVDAHQSPAAYLAAHPDVARRCDDDIAFKAGFDGAVYAREHGQWDDMMTALDRRDVRYEAHHVAYRG